MTRSFSWFGACPWSDGDGFGWIRSLLHGTTVGRQLVRGHFESMSASSLHQSGILKDAKKRLGTGPELNVVWHTGQHIDI